MEREGDRWHSAPIHACTNGDHHDIFTGEHFHRTALSASPCEWCGSSESGARYCAVTVGK
jgi:hypothetical protein